MLMIPEMHYKKSGCVNYLISIQEKGLHREFRRGFLRELRKGLL